MDKKILILAILFAALGFGVYNKLNNDKKDINQESRTNFISNKILSDTKVIEITSNDTKTILGIKDNTWVVKNRFNWDSDFTKIQGLIKNLKDIKIVHSFTPDKDSLTKLKLLNPSKDKAEKTGIAIELKDGEGKSLFSILKGKNREKGGQYIIRNNEKNILLSESSIYVQTKPSDWLKSELIDIKKDKVLNIALYTSKKKKVYHLNIDKELLKPSLIYPKKNKKDLDKEKMDELFSSLSKLEFSDIEKEKSKDDDYDFLLNFELVDETTISIYIHPSNKDKNLISFQTKGLDDKKDIKYAKNFENYIFSVSKWEFEKFITNIDDIFQKDKK